MPSRPLPPGFVLSGPLPSGACAAPLPFVDPWPSAPAGRAPPLRRPRPPRRRRREAPPDPVPDPAPAPVPAPAASAGSPAAEPRGRGERPSGADDPAVVTRATGAGRESPIFGRAGPSGWGPPGNGPPGDACPDPPGAGLSGERASEPDVCGSTAGADRSGAALDPPGGAAAPGGVTCPAAGDVRPSSARPLIGSDIRKIPSRVYAATAYRVQRSVGVAAVPLGHRLEPAGIADFRRKTAGFSLSVGGGAAAMRDPPARSERESRTADDDCQYARGEHLQPTAQRRVVHLAHQSRQREPPTFAYPAGFFGMTAGCTG
jgi:hypothetical protein